MLIRPLKALFVGMLILWFSSAALGCQPQEPPGKADAPLVLVDATVLVKKTGAVAGDLKREDFILHENGIRQEIAHFSREELPLSVALLLDVSGSVRPIMGEVRQAGLDALARLKPRDKVALMVFAERPRLIAELTADRTQIMKKMDRIRLGTAGVGTATSINLG